LKIEDALKAGVTVLTTLGFLWVSLTARIQGQILGVVFLALVVWSLYPKRHVESSILVLVLLSFFQASIGLEEFISSILSTYGGSGFWIIVSGFILAKATETSGLGRRIALGITTSLGGKPGSIILSVAVASLAVAPLSPSTTAKAFLLLPICTGLVEAFNVEKGRSKYGAAVMLMSMAANNIGSTAFLTATVPNPISVQYIKEATGLDLDWLGWNGMALPLSLLLLAVCWLVCVRMFRPEVKETAESLERMKSLSDGLGPMNRAEKTVAVFFCSALLLWITEGLHGLNSGLFSLGISLVLLMPKIGVIKISGLAREVPWGSITLFAASMFLARAVGRWRALDPVAQSVFNLINPSGVEPMLFVSLVVLVSMLLHVFFTSTTVYATVMIPLVISLAQLQGINPLMVALPVAFLTPVAVILPINTIPNIVFHSTGYFTQKQMIAYGLIMSLLSVAIVLLFGLPYWGLLGLA